MSVIVVKDIGASFKDFKRTVQSLEPLYNDGYGYVIVPPGDKGTMIIERGIMNNPSLALNAIESILGKSGVLYKVALHMRNLWMESDGSFPKMRETQPTALAFKENQFVEIYRQQQTFIPMLMSSLSPVVDSVDINNKKTGLSEYVVLSKFVRDYMTDSEKVNMVKAPKDFYNLREDEFLNGSNKLLLIKRGEFHYLPNKKAYHEIKRGIFISDASATRLAIETLSENSKSFPKLNKGVDRFRSFTNKVGKIEEVYVGAKTEKKKHVYEELKEQLIVVKNDKEPFNSHKIFKILKVENEQMTMCLYSNYYDSENVTGNRECETQLAKVINLSEISIDPEDLQHPYHLMFNTTIQK